MTAAVPPLRGEFATLAEAMGAAAEQFADRDAYVDGERRLTFAEWIAAGERAAGALVERGVGPGDVVAIMLPPSIEFAIAFAAAMTVGAVATGINTRLGQCEVVAICARVEPSAAFVPEDVPAGLPLSTSLVDPAALRAAATSPHRAARRHRQASDPAVVVWTSGTTGQPKGAWFDHDNLRAAVHTAGAMTAPFDRRLASLPFAHAGYMAKVWEQVAWATALVISPLPWRAADMLRLLVEERITVAGAVPTQWARLLEEPGLDGADLSALRLGIAATAPAAPELVERVVARCGCPVVVRYAMTESPSITGTEPSDPPEVQFRTVGRPQTGVELSLRGADGTPVSDGEVGRVHVRGACVMRGYWKDAEATAEVLGDDDWLRTGDLGHRDADGNLVLDGRVGDMYIRGGYNVYPVAVENVLAEHPAIDEVAVVGVPEPQLGEIGVAFVVLVAGCEPPSLEDVRAFCRDRIADYRAPDRLVVLAELPLTPMLKVDKALLRRGGVNPPG